MICRLPLCTLGANDELGSVIGKYSPNPDYNIPTYFTYYDKTIEADQDVLFYAIDKSKDRSAYEGYVRCIMWMDHSLNLKT